MPVGHYQPHTPRPGPEARPDLDFPLDNRQWSQRSLLAGLVGTILFHLLFFFGIPPSYLDMSTREEKAPVEDFDIEIAGEEAPEPEPEPGFVETNRQAPENIPDDTDNFAARNQQAANPEPAKELSPDRTPARDGEDEVPFDKIFAGDLNPPELAQPSQESPASPEEVQPGMPERRDPLPGFELDETEAEEGAGSAIADASEKPSPVPERVEGAEAETADRELPAFVSPLSTSNPTPAPRPRLPRALPGPVKRQPAGVSQAGIIGVDAKFSEFGDYIERLVEAVSQRWTALCASRAYAETNARVAIEFTITRDGIVTRMTTMENSSQALGVLLARSAIEQGQPYGVWTKEMVDTLGTQQNITLNFHYW